jgi:hypothetical protein
MGAYVKGILLAKANPDAEFSRSLCGWAPASGRQIMAEFFDMVRDHCNRGLVIAGEIGMKRALRRWKAGIPSRCRECGAEFLRHYPNNDNDRYCSPGCRAA